MLQPIIVPPGPTRMHPQSMEMARTIIPHNYENGFVQQFNLFVERKVGSWLLLGRIFRLPWLAASSRVLPEWRKHHAL